MFAGTFKYLQPFIESKIYLSRFILEICSSRFILREFILHFALLKNKPFTEKQPWTTG